MKQSLIAIAIAVSLSASPVLAFNIDTSSLTPALTYPEPAPQPVTKAQGGIAG